MQTLLKDMLSFDHLGSFLEIFVAINFAFSFSEIRHYLDNIFGINEEEENSMIKEITTAIERFYDNLPPSKRVDRDRFDETMDYTIKLYKDLSNFDSTKFAELCFIAAWYCLTCIILNSLMRFNSKVYNYFFLFNTASLMFLTITIGNQLVKNRIYHNKFTVIIIYASFFIGLAIGDKFLDYNIIFKGIIPSQMTDVETLNFVHFYMSVIIIFIATSHFIIYYFQNSLMRFLAIRALYKRAIKVISHMTDKAP